MAPNNTPDPFILFSDGTLEPKPVPKRLQPHRTAKSTTPTPNPLQRLDALRHLAKSLFAQCDQPQLAKTIAVTWNPKLRSTAGRTRYALSLVELNPRLLAFAGEDERTLRHELAHILAWERHRRTRNRKIAPHGPEWRQACTDLGIPGEAATHTLPLPTRRLPRPYKYQCPHCGHIMERSRPIKHPSACLACCQKHTNGNFDRKFLFQLIPPLTKTQRKT